MSRAFLDLQSETNLLDEVAHRRQRLSAQRRTVLPQQALLADSYADAYPWMDPSAVGSMVMAGLPPDSPNALAIADLAAQQASEEGELSSVDEDVPDSWLGTLADTVFGWAKPVVRTGFTILATPFEELQAWLSSAGTALFDETEAGQFGLLSDIGGNLGSIATELRHPDKLIGDFWTNYTSQAARSTGLLAAADLVQGKDVDLGEGFLPAGGIFEEREKAKHRLTLDGHFVTPGRLVARQFTEPGTGQYQFVSGLNDLAQNLLLDPAAIVTGGLSKAAKANKAFQTVGMIGGVRKTVDPARAVDHYLTSPVGQRLVSWMTQTSDVDEIWRGLGRSNLDAARRLAGTRTETESFEALSEMLGTLIREKPTAGFASRAVGSIGGNEYGALFGGGARARWSMNNSRIATLSRLGRLGEDVPASHINIHDLDDAAVNLDQWMANAQTPAALRAKVVGELAELQPGDQVGVFETVRRALDSSEGLLVSEWGVAPSRARRLTSMYSDLSDDLRTFDVDDLGRHVDVLAPLRVNVGDQIIDARPTPGLVSELIDDVIPLPDHKEIRRLTPAVKQMQRLYDSGLWKGSVDGLDSVMTSIWKPLQLLRGAYTVRVIGEEQIRMGGSGYDSLIRNPMSAIAWSLSVDPKSRLGRKLAQAAKTVVDPKGTTNVLGETWDDIAEHASALSRGSAGHRGLPGEILTGRYVKARQGEAGFYQGWVAELAHEANDPVMRRVAGGLSDGDLRSIGREASRGTFDDVSEWWWSGTGQKFRKELGGMEGRSALLHDRTAADAYLQQNLFDRLARMTGGNSDLTKLVATGHLDDISLHGFGHESKLARLLEDSYSSAAPQYVKSPEALARGGSGALTAARLNRAVERSFDSLMSRPTNWLSRSPTFRQKYWQRIDELITSAPSKVQKEAIAAARAANIGDGAVRDLAAKSVRGTGGDKLESLADLDILAKSFALDETRKLLYDLQKRSQFFDMMRVVFPFGEAWKEIITSWTGILRQNPQTIRRFQQGIEGARAPSLLPGAEAETDEGTGRGFFAPDPSSGVETFHYPGGQWVSKLLGLSTEGGAGVDLTGTAAGLNIVSATVLPGFGPVVQIPASHLIPNTPKWDDVRDILLPFGPVEGPVSAVAPAWLEKIQTAFEEPDPDQNRLFANTVTDVMRALQATGKYSMTSREGQQRLLDDATKKARILYLVRGAAQFVAPTGPAFSWTAEDVQGNVVPVKLLSDELRRLTTEEYGGNRQEAFDEWVRRFGIDNVLATIGKSTALVERPITEKGDAWLRANADLEREFELTIGYFAPEPAVGEFDYTAYLRQFETGAREALSPAEQLAMANDFLGRVQFEQAKKLAALRPGPQTSLWLGQVRNQIATDYPGFDGWVSASVWSRRPSIDQQVEELRRAVANPTLAATDTGEGVRKYLSAVDAAGQMVRMLPGNVTRYQQADAARPVRDWLRSVARQIIEENPDFARVWGSVFERELADDPVGIGAAA